MIAGVGFLTEDTTEMHLHDNVKSWNFVGIREPELLGILETAIRDETWPGSERCPPQLITDLGTGGMMAQSVRKYLWWFDESKFTYLMQVDTHQALLDDGDESVPLNLLLAQPAA